MNKLKEISKKVFIFIMIILLMIAFSSSYESYSIDNLAFVVAVGIDSGDNNNLKVTFQFGVSSSVSESGSTEESPSVINTVEASSIDTAINLMNSYIGKQLTLSHCKIIVFSEKIATSGISNEIYSLMNNIQVRPSTNIVVSKCDAKYYIQNSQPLLESIITKYYEVFPTSSSYTGFTSNITIGDFYRKITCPACEPTAILGGITSSDKHSSDNMTAKSNNSPIIGDRGSENIGLAVFKDDTLVGELNAIETICYSLMNNDINGFLITIPDPQNKKNYIDIYLYHDDPTKSKVFIVNESPYITIDLKLKGRIYSMASGSDYSNPDSLEIISSAVNTYMESIVLDYLYKTAKVFKSDINAFGREALSIFLTRKEFNDYKWLERYADSFFQVTVSSNIKTGFLLSES